ncbi:OmpA family protein [Chitinimonas sp. BJYL2]|uniref:OmpA family protein n=1 Tax=Chitinimonas sp. BJYL2 TaxID=2976696 RepID=UPI0022B4F9E1|nr:OmpA family protein [Chitinimonas sp. BJYL2]
MEKPNAKPGLLIIAALLAACSTVPMTTSLLDQTRRDYSAAQNNPAVVRHAALELKLAGDALELANVAAKRDDSIVQIDRLAYVAKQKVALAHEVAKQKSAEISVAGAAQERDRMRLAQRTNEADQAKSAADQARMDTRLAQSDTADAQRAAQDAQRSTADAQARAAMLESQMAALSAKQTERGLVITLGAVLFATDQASLNSTGQQTIQKLAEVLQQNPQRTVLIEGFTDNTGTTLHNQALSERRANAVRTALQERGVMANRVAVRGYGESFPVGDNETASNRQTNRRVEIVLSDETGHVNPR